MSDKPTILFVEDDIETATDFIDDIQSNIEVTVKHVVPPINISDFADIVKNNDVKAVILDEVFQTHSEATYMGIDASEYLQELYPNLPIDILTDFPPGPEFQGRRVSLENFHRKGDLEKNDEYRNKYFAQLLINIENYQKQLDNRQDQLISLKEMIDKGEINSEIVTEDLMIKLKDIYFESDQAIEAIVWFYDDNPKQTWILIVNRTAIATESVDVFKLNPSEEVPFTQLIAEVTPKEWELIQSGDIKLPEAWTIDNSKIFSKE